MQGCQFLVLVFGMSTVLRCGDHKDDLVMLIGVGTWNGVRWNSLVVVVVVGGVEIWNRVTVLLFSFSGLSEFSEKLLWNMIEPHDGLLAVFTSEKRLEARRSGVCVWRLQRRAPDWLRSDEPE